MGSEPAVRVTDVTHRFRDVLAVDTVSIDIRAGEFVTLLGPSGSGKTTLLRIIAGLTQPTRGRIFIRGRDVTQLPTQKRGVGFVFQNYALFPHLNVYENVAYPLRIRKVAGEEVRRRVGGALARVNLAGVEHRHPTQLSGGQQQRVAVARALVYEPAVLLMDEPLGALDRKLRRHMQVELRQLQQDLRITCIYVTHDQEEALTMSDQVAVMRDGRLLQMDEPMRLYRSPADSFVADFVGSTNLITCTLRERSVGPRILVSDGGSQFPAPALSDLANGASVHVAIRPEAIRFGPAEGVDVTLRAKVVKATFVGSVIDITCELDTRERLIAQVAGGGGEHVGLGETVQIGWNLEDMSVFPGGGREQSRQ
jgi:putative spermidine/putrescine transport system ATP-binding protein